MSGITYQVLADKWKTQETQFGAWRIGLAREAHGLRNDIASALQGPDKWVTYDKREERRYVEVIDLSTSDMVPMKVFPSDAITDDGELVFGISFTFDHALNTYPKSLYQIAMAVRYKDSTPEFCQWDVRLKAAMAGSSWQRDKQKVVKDILAVLDRHLSFDPFQGIPGKSGIGFIQAK